MKYIFSQVCEELWMEKSISTYPRWVQSWLKEARKVFQHFINKLQETGSVTVWIEKSSFS